MAMLLKGKAKRRQKIPQRKDQKTKICDAMQVGCMPRGGMKRICKVFIPQNSRSHDEVMAGEGAVEGGGARSEGLPPEWPDKNMDGG